MRLTEEMKKCREEMIYNAFHLFCEKGIDTVSLMKIAKKSRVSEVTIYCYFDSKEQLVLESFIKLWETIMHKIYKKVDETSNYESLTGFEQIQVWIESFWCLYQEDTEFIIFSYKAKLYFLRHNMKFRLQLLVLCTVGPSSSSDSKQQQVLKQETAKDKKRGYCTISCFNDYAIPSFQK